MNTLVSTAERVGAQFSAEFEDGEPLIQHITQQYGSNADANESGPHLATVRLDLLGAEERESLIGDVIIAWKKEVGTLAEPISLVFKEPTLGPGGRDIELRIKHPDLASLKEVSVTIQQYLAKFDGISGIIDDMRMGKEEILVSLQIFFKSIKFLMYWSDNKPISIVYLPSPITCYNWDEPIEYNIKHIC